MKTRTIVTSQIDRLELRSARIIISSALFTNDESFILSYGKLLKAFAEFMN